MTPGQEATARIIARLTAHEFLLENLFALALSTAPEPLAAVHATKERAVALMERTTAKPSGDVEFVETFMAELRSIVPDFFDRVRNRVADGLPN